MGTSYNNCFDDWGLSLTPRLDPERNYIILLLLLIGPNGIHIFGLWDAGHLDSIKNINIVVQYLMMTHVRLCQKG